MVSFYNLTQQYEDQKMDIMRAIHNVATGGQYFADIAVTEFESIISTLYNRASVCFTNSGTSALTVALKAARLPRNSVIAIPAMTYIATANAVRAAGHHPICIDIDECWLMSYDHLKNHLELDKEKKIKAIVLVDLYGQGADLHKFKQLCDGYDVKIIIDAAQSFDLGYDFYHQIDYCESLALSFNPLKNLGAMGNAGAVVSKVHTVEQLKRWTIHNKVFNDVVEHGYNCRGDAIQAAVLKVKYQQFDENMKQKHSISWYYQNQLQNFVEMPQRTYQCTHMFYVFAIAPKDPVRVREALTGAGIEFGCHYDKPIHHYTAYKEEKDYCPNATNLKGRIISLPNHWHLTSSDVEHVVQVVRSAL